MQSISSPSPSSIPKHTSSLNTSNNVIYSNKNLFPASNSSNTVYSNHQDLAQTVFVNAPTTNKEVKETRVIPKNIITSSGVFLKTPKKGAIGNTEKIRTYMFFNPENETMESSIEKAKAAISSEIILKNREITFSMDDLGTLLEDTPSLTRKGKTLSLNEPTWKQLKLSQEQGLLKQNNVIAQLNTRISQQDNEIEQLKKDNEILNKQQLMLKTKFDFVKRAHMNPTLIAIDVTDIISHLFHHSLAHSESLKKLVENNLGSQFAKALPFAGPVISIVSGVWRANYARKNSHNGIQYGLAALEVGSGAVSIFFTPATAAASSTKFGVELLVSFAVIITDTAYGIKHIGKVKGPDEARSILNLNTNENVKDRIDEAFNALLSYAAAHIDEKETQEHYRTFCNVERRVTLDEIKNFLQDAKDTIYRNENWELPWESLTAWEKVVGRRFVAVQTQNTVSNQETVDEALTHITTVTSTATSTQGQIQYPPDFRQSQSHNYNERSPLLNINTSPYYDGSHKEDEEKSKV